MSRMHLAGAAALLFACLATGTATASADELKKNIPSVDGLVRYGCLVKGPIVRINHADPSGKKRSVWSVTFWAEHMGALGAKIRKDWKLLYSFRSKRSKGLSDCDKFMDRVRKAQRKKETSPRHSVTPAANAFTNSATPGSKD